MRTSNQFRSGKFRRFKDLLRESPAAYLFGSFRTILSEGRAAAATNSELAWRFSGRRSARSSTSSLPRFLLVPFPLSAGESRDAAGAGDCDGEWRLIWTCCGVLRTGMECAVADGAVVVMCAIWEDAATSGLRGSDPEKGTFSLTMRDLGTLAFLRGAVGTGCGTGGEVVVDA